MIELDYVFTRFIIIEKHINDRFYTPHFNQYGEIIRFKGSFANGRIFVSPGIYVREKDETTIVSSNIGSMMYVAGVDVATSSNPVDVNIIVSYTIE